MAKLIVLQGLPASGKSTKAKELMDQYGNFVRLNRDLLRTMLHFDKWNGRNEGITRDIQISIARKLLSDNQNVIVDDTNLGKNHIATWKTIAKETDSKVDVINIDTPIEECIERDSHRDKMVGREVIYKLAMKYGRFRTKNGYLICDIDGTIANLDHRLHYVKQDPKDWKGFFSCIMDDLPRKDIIESVYNRVIKDDLDLVFVSGRSVECEEQTKEWIKLNAPQLYAVYKALIMRDFHDRREDNLVKKDILNTYFDKSKVMVVYDDRPQVLRMWREELEDTEINDVGSGIEF